MRRPRPLVAVLALALVAIGVVSVDRTVPAQAADSPYLVGRGISDVTGPAAENGMMGYSKFGQNTTGLHQRLRARAFVTVEQASGQRVAYVNADLGMIFQAQRDAVLAKLQAKYGTLYTTRNLLLSATHTHSGPGGQSHNLAYNLSILGFQKQAFDATVEAVTEAHQNLAPGTISLGRSTLTNASVNRSRVAFEQNPAADRAAFPQAIDPAVTVLRFQQGGNEIGAISWFATHATSITNENTLISPDNKGYAAYRWEHDEKGVRYLDESQGFVAAFPNTNAGDMSPNLNLRAGSGPTEDPLLNEQILGDRQQQAAAQAYNGPRATITGSIDARMRYVDMSAVQVAPQYTPDGQPHRTCPGVVGASTLAGSVEDGPGIAIIPEGVTNPFFELLKPFNVDVPPWLISCQSPKLAAVPTGLLQATPDIVPIQLVKLGQFYLVAVPGEVTIVAGLRLRRTVAAEVGVPLENVLIQGYANAYSQYVTTPEEYQLQQYEGGSTLFGKYTLPAYQQEFAGLARALEAGTPVAAGTHPPKPATAELNLQTGVVFDSPPLFKSFGQVLTDAAPQYQRGATVAVSFVTGHPKNNLHRNGTFLEVQRQVGGQWQRVADDGDWDTRYQWARTGVADSKATITWKATEPGTYRILHHGDSKALNGTITPFTGMSRTFTVS
ncbi:neutral/alkaline ceramidase [Kribbella sp. CA-293567]|uniref:neutral/alkaline ceramidase n=1 Tax=Kribbella sp. CA-293567 TaxID=3002436 RepID=UPI0022DD7C1E|nr:neutral/alkaline ceramidase [Kribbella sp. CA-293567]WBQ04816.1 neutral/alkaline ceramidase [Kribbella sp. CA-293567]